MTIIGAIANQHGIIAWGDSEIFTWSGMPTGRHRRKLAVNASAALFGAGCGWSDLAEAAEQIVHHSHDFDEAVDRIPSSLRQAAVRSAKVFKPDPRSFSGCAYLLAGVSDKFGRALVCRFDALGFFVPEFATAFAVPETAGARRPLCQDDVLQAAREQMRQLRKGTPAAGAGHLTIAALSSAGISITTHRNFATELLLADEETPPCPMLTHMSGFAPQPEPAPQPS